MTDTRKTLNTTRIRGRLECAKFLWEKEEKETEYKKELEEEIVFLRRLLIYTDNFN